MSFETFTTNGGRRGYFTHKNAFIRNGVTHHHVTIEDEPGSGNLVLAFISSKDLAPERSVSRK